jgi:hypothetical protein
VGLGGVGISDRFPNTLYCCVLLLVYGARFRQKSTLADAIGSLDHTHVRLKLLHVCDQWHSSRKFTPLTGWHGKLCRNTEGKHKKHQTYLDDRLKMRSVLHAWFCCAPLCARLSPSISRTYTHTAVYLSGCLAVSLSRARARALSLTHALRFSLSHTHTRTSLLFLSLSHTHTHTHTHTSLLFLSTPKA